MAAIQNMIIKGKQRSHLLDKVMYRILVAIEYMFCILRYDELLSEDSIETEAENQKRKFQLEDGSYKHLNKISGTGVYDI